VSNIEQLLLDLKEGVEREIRQLQGSAEQGFAQVSTRFDTGAGARWRSRTDAWVEHVNGALEVQDREIADLRERLIKLERKAG